MLGLVLAIVAVSVLRLSLSVRRMESRIVAAREERARAHNELMLRAEMIEVVETVSWQLLYTFVPESSDYDYCDYVLERIRGALHRCTVLQQSLSEAEERRRARGLPGRVGPLFRGQSQSLRELTNAFRLIKSKFHAEPWRIPPVAGVQPPAGKGEAVTEEAGAGQTAQGPAAEGRPAEANS